MLSAGPGAGSRTLRPTYLPRPSRALETELAHLPWAVNPTMGLAILGGGPRVFLLHHFPSQARPKMKAPKGASCLPSFVQRGHSCFLVLLSHRI